MNVHREPMTTVTVGSIAIDLARSGCIRSRDLSCPGAASSFLSRGPAERAWS
jgi:hypothetical protein